MNTPADLANSLRIAFPLARVEVDAPLHSTGSFHIDVRLGDRLVVVEWSTRNAIGVSLVEVAALEQGPDEHVTDPDEALRVVARMLHHASLTPEEKKRFTDELDHSPELLTSQAVLQSANSNVEASAQLHWEDQPLSPNHPPRQHPSNAA